MARNSKLTAAERKHLREFGTMPGRDATDLEMMMYRTCVEFRQSQFYRVDDLAARRLLRAMIRSFAVTLVWKQNVDQPVMMDQVKSMEREFMQRAKDDPPF